MERTLKRMAYGAAICAMVALVALAASSVLCEQAQAATVTKDGIVYQTHTVKNKRWVDGGPNYRYQATIVKVKDRTKTRYHIPRTITYKKHAYVVTEIVGSPFKACKKARAISVRAPLAYIEDVTFWRRDKRKVKITIYNCGAYDYVMSATTALIQ